MAFAEVWAPAITSFANCLAEVVERRRGKVTRREFERGAKTVELAGLFAVFDVILGAVFQKSGGQLGDGNARTRRSVLRDDGNAIGG